MKVLGLLIITAALVLGVAVAPTAYLARLDLPDETLVGLTLNAPAGSQEPETPSADPTAPGEPIATPNTQLTPELLTVLRADNVERVRVKEFAFDRWSGRWWFLLAVLGLLIGATFVRMDARKRLAASRDAAPSEDTGSPHASLAAIIEAIDSLRRDMPHMTTAHDREAAIIDRLGEAQSTHVPAFVDSRERIISARGLAGYAAIMDRFAAMERQINRAWSAAADGVEDEAADCLERASALAQETRAVLEKA